MSQHPDHDWLCEETAWVTIEKRGWIATPMLLMWLTRFVKELELDKHGCEEGLQPGAHTHGRAPGQDCKL